MKQEINNSRMLPMSQIAVNNGQMDGVRANPRQIKGEKFDRLKASIERNPEMLALRELLVYEHDGKYIVIGGNMRYRACKELGYTQMPCKIIPPQATAEQLNAYIILDNSGFGDWDWDALANEWDSAQLTDWGVDVPNWDEEASEECSDEPLSAECVKNDVAENLLNQAMVENCQEFLKHLEVMENAGFFATGMTAGAVKAEFIRAKYYGETFRQVTSMYWVPQRFKTAADKKSVYEVICDIASGKTTVGIAGLRTATKDGNLRRMFSGSYPVASARVPLDFPSKKMKALCDEFCKKGGIVLDPCHGWGGRFVGAMLSNVGGYIGVDPSNVAHNGLEKAKKLLLEYSDMKIAEFYKMPFEETKFDNDSFDFAITSPPYFDVEKYEGENTSSVKFPSYEKWVNGFYTPLIRKTYNYLKKGCYFVLQVGSQSYPLAIDGQEIATEVGFTVVDVRKFGGQESSGLHSDNEDKNEKIIILKK
jgi:hypothetical protein|nr:MAG TPA_asm: Putative modification methylase [Caudoviricetes sp.]